jgi:secreted trypsin-like serine protease
LLGFCAAPALGQTPAPDADDRPGVLLPDPFDDSLSMRGDAKIVGGEPARRNAWPWQVAIYRRAVKNGTPLGAGFLFCGGSLISSKWVLTAAHCFEPERSGAYDAASAADIVVVEGTNVLAPSRFGGGNGNGKKLRVARILVHEAWNARSMENDIALIELASPAASKPVGLPPSVPGSTRRTTDSPLERLESEGVMALVTGWGHLGFDDPKVPANLMQVEIPLVSVESCNQAYANRGGVIDHRTICAGEKEGGKDACQGDSGGPLVVAQADGGYAQVGIVSWGRRCGLANFYGVYTRVSAFGDWLAAKTGLAAPAPAVVAVAPAAPAPSPALPPQAAPPSLPQSTTARGDRALLVGIDEYENPKFNLRGSVNDVHNMRQLLLDTFGFQPGQIATLTDAQATRANILKTFDEWLVRGSAPGARVFFFVSSHGAQVPDLNGDEEDGLDETIVPHDTRLEMQNGKKVLRNQIIDDEIDALLKRIPDRKATVVVDACHSGTGTRGMEPSAFEPGTVKCLCALLDDYDPRVLVSADRGDQIVSTRSAAPKLGFLERHDNVVAWSAVNDGQFALVDTESEEPQSVFTRRFIAGVRQAAAGGDGPMSHARLLDRLRKESQEYCARHQKNCPAGLSPQLEARADVLALDVVSGRPPARPQDVPQNVLVHDNSAGVTVDFVQGSELRVGQAAQFRVRTQQPGYLVLLDVGPDGRVTQVFPNARSLSTPTGGRRNANLVTPDRPLLVPDPANPYAGLEYRIDPPSGDGRLIAILSKDAIRAVAVPETPSTLDGDAGSAFVAQIAEELLREPVIAGHVRKREWSVAQKPYRINP